MDAAAIDESVKNTYTSILSKLYNALNLLEEDGDNELASFSISESIDLVSNLMYSDPRC